MKFRDEVNKQKQMQESNHKLIQTSLQTLKSEIETVKGMLLNKKQFASPSSMTIPSWQLTKKKDKNNDDAHSANSSENDTEVIPEDSSSREHEKRSPANSDSSLEIM
jgi:peroxin-14